VRLMVLVLALGSTAQPAQRLYTLNGRIVPESKAAVSVFGALTPFHVETLSDSRGRFRLRSLFPGEYTVAVFIPSQGEVRRTVEVGPGTADARGQIVIAVSIESISREALHQHATVSAHELSVPEAARREYAEAQKKLARREVASAVLHLEKAVEIAPQFSHAWNNLGTIAYQTREYARAEEHFRKALEQDAGSFEPLVNLGGVLLTEGKRDEALKYNLYAVLSRPRDALANAQLGLTYFAVGSLDLAEKYLELAKRIDPAHFSFPQLTLAQIHLRRNQPRAAAGEFQDFLQRHPDAPEADRVRELLAAGER
jgi:tetratricopeptide (TPR) repeat protein